MLISHTRCYSFILVILFVTALAHPVHAVETISGRVLDASTSNPITGVDLDVFDAAGDRVSVTGAVTDGNGDYLIVLPGSGTYILRVDASLGDGVADQYYSGVFLKSQATVLTIDTNGALININFSLESGVEITGSVLFSGVGEPDVDLDLFASNGEFLASYPGISAGDGSYAIGDLPPGDYFLRADPDVSLGQLFVPTFFGGGIDISTATPIAVGGSDVGGINITLPAGGTIAGQVTSVSGGAPLANIDIDAFDSVGTRLSVNASTDLSGNYEIGGLPTGDYFVRADPTFGQGFPRIYYPNAAVIDGAALIPVTVSIQTPNIDIALPPGGTISGRVSDAGTGQPIANMDLDVFDSAGVRVSIDAVTDTNGDYILGPLAAGNYTVRADPTPAQGYPLTYYLGVQSNSAATPLHVSSGGSVTGVNFSLALGGSISGVIREAGTFTLLPGIDIDAFDVSGNRVQVSATTDGAGQYQIGPLAPGLYFVRADPTIAQGYADQFYLNKVDLNLADSVFVTSSQDTPDIDFTMAAAGWIEGTIVDTLAQPLEGIDLDLFDAATGIRLRASATTAIDGTYRFDSLGPGQYRVRADATLAQGFVLTYYDGKLTLAQSDTIAVATGAGASNIDFTLAQGGSISGMVFDAGAGGLGEFRNVDIDVFVAGTFFRMDQSAKTDADGNYSLVGLPPGNYIVRADPTPVQLLPIRYFDDAQFRESAAPISVTAGSDVTGIDIIYDPGLPAAGAIGLALLALSLATRGALRLHRRKR